MKKATLCLAIAATMCVGVHAIEESKAIITYKCRAIATGQVEARAAVGSAGGVFSSDSDSANLGGVFGPTDPYTLMFSGGAGVSAGVLESFFECCWTDASAEVKGDTKYDFAGSTLDMDFFATSARSHENRIRRSPFGICLGGEAFADSWYEVPQVDSLNVTVPFHIEDYGFAVPVAVDFYLRRGDSGPTTGNTIGVWQLFRDENCNCEWDSGEELIAWDKWSIGPNDSYQMPTQNFELKPGCYIMQYTYFTWSELALDSEDCLDSVRASSDVTDEMGVYLQVFP